MPTRRQRTAASDVHDPERRARSGKKKTAKKKAGKKKSRRKSVRRGPELLRTVVSEVRLVDLIAHDTESAEGQINALLADGWKVEISLSRPSDRFLMLVRFGYSKGIGGAYVGDLIYEDELPSEASPSPEA